MIQDLLHRVDEALFLDNIDTEDTDTGLCWTDNFGAENEVDRNQIAAQGDRLAWWQKNEVGKELLRIQLSKELIINWRPPINTMGLGSPGCAFLEFYEDLLIVQYPDKHHDRVFVIDLPNLNFVEVPLQGRVIGLERTADRLTVQGSISRVRTVTVLQSGNIVTSPMEDN
ncbi:MAG: hypothetical protein AAF598_07950 [Bacteroidota bacterium]